MRRGRGAYCDKLKGIREKGEGGILCESKRYKGEGGGGHIVRI